MTMARIIMIMAMIIMILICVLEVCKDGYNNYTVPLLKGSFADEILLRGQRVNMTIYCSSNRVYTNP